MIADWEFELVPEADGFDNERFLLFDQGDLHANPANKPPPVIDSYTCHCK